MSVEVQNLLQDFSKLTADTSSFNTFFFSFRGISEAIFQLPSSESKGVVFFYSPGKVTLHKKPKKRVCDQKVFFFSLSARKQKCAFTSETERLRFFTPSILRKKWSIITAYLESKYNLPISKVE